MNDLLAVIERQREEEKRRQERARRSAALILERVGLENAVVILNNMRADQSISADRIIDALNTLLYEKAEEERKSRDGQR
jgi:hypothetical protein